MTIPPPIMRDQGRVFFCSIGHTIDDLRVPQVTEIMKRGMVWAASGRTSDTTAIAG